MRPRNVSPPNDSGTTVPFLRQLTTVGSRERDPRAPWALSIAFRALIPVEAITPAAGKRIEALEWRDVEQATADSTLAFDHAALIQAAVAATRHEVEALELPFDFLPAQFTLGELQGCCESLLGRRLTNPASGVASMIATWSSRFLEK